MLLAANTVGHTPCIPGLILNQQDTAEQSSMKPHHVLIVPLSYTPLPPMPKPTAQPHPDNPCPAALHPNTTLIHSACLAAQGGSRLNTTPSRHLVRILFSYGRMGMYPTKHLQDTPTAVRPQHHHLLISSSGNQAAVRAPPQTQAQCNAEHHPQAGASGSALKALCVKRAPDCKSD